ncbi:hypothetical protein ACN9MB_13205 [Dyella kyungheensis]|uniref:hypothetical protein n=1 Tax=Dyella kyungheensis TaxID=1242174 RepID=UPI003CEC2BAB
MTLQPNRAEEGASRSSRHGNRGLRAGSVFSRIMEILAEGPSLSDEIAVTIGVEPKVASAYLNSLRQRGYAYAKDGVFDENGRTESLWYPTKEAA